MRNRILIKLANNIAEAAAVIVIATERRHAHDIAARARGIEQEARRLAAELRTTIEPTPVREVVADVIRDLPPAE